MIRREAAIWLGTIVFTLAVSVRAVQAGGALARPETSALLAAGLTVRLPDYGVDPLNAPRIAAVDPGIINEALEENQAHGELRPPAIQALDATAAAVARPTFAPLPTQPPNPEATGTDPTSAVVVPADLSPAASVESVQASPTSAPTEATVSPTITAKSSPTRTGKPSATPTRTPSKTPSPRPTGTATRPTPTPPRPTSTPVPPSDTPVPPPTATEEKGGGGPDCENHPNPDKPRPCRTPSATPG